MSNVFFKQFQCECFGCLFKLATGAHLQSMAASTSTYETEIEVTPGILCAELFYN